MASKSFLIILLFSLPFISSIEDKKQLEQQQNKQDHHRDKVLSLLERHESQLNRLETLIESLSKSISLLESSRSIAAQSKTLESIAITHQKPSFYQYFIFSAAARLESKPTCAAVLPYADTHGAAKYFAFGDARGVTFVISTRGDVILEIPAVSDAEVTAILTYLSPSKRNESLLYIGHGDGSVAAHRIFESSRRLELAESRLFVRGSRDLDSPPVVILELHRIGMTRYVVAADGGGRIRVFMEGAGTLYGTAIASSRPLVFMRQRLLFLTETGAGSLDLR